MAPFDKNKWRNPHQAHLTSATCGWQWNLQGRALQASMVDAAELDRAVNLLIVLPSIQIHELDRAANLIVLPAIQIHELEVANPIALPAIQIHEMHRNAQELVHEMKEIQELVNEMCAACARHGRHAELVSEMCAACARPGSP